MKKGLTSNSLKTIAIVIMILDHIAGYLYQHFTQDTYYTIRCIGRLAMPLFAYMIVQGFFYTKNLGKYIFRVFIVATLTQIGLLTLGIVNQEMYPIYWTGVNNYFNVVYSYTISLILIAIIDRKIVIKKCSENQNLLLRINLFILVVLAYFNFKIEFDMQLPFLVLELYGIEKLFEKDKKLLLKQDNISFKNRILYLGLILLALAFSTCFLNYSSGNKFVALWSVLIIALYNGEKGKKNAFIQTLFYIVFPIQHIVLYWLGMYLM